MDGSRFGCGEPGIADPKVKTNERLPKSRPFRARSAQDLGVAVKHFRTLAGLSQAELAARVGLHRTYLTDLERGHVTEALERVMTLFRELGVRVNIVQEG